MRVLILGANGQLGQAIARAAEIDTGFTVTGWQRPAHDVANPAITEAIADFAPDLVVNCAAWTNVDGAESEPDQAYAVNALGAKYVADGCAACGAPLVHVSTNEVFTGEIGRIYREYDLPGPGGVYARSKLAGERAACMAWDQVYVVRVAWLFGRGQGDFPSKILAAAATRPVLRVVADEFGNPTYAPHVANAILTLAQTRRFGHYHFVNEGSSTPRQTSRFEWTRFLFEQLRHTIELEPIAASEWPRPVPPPSHAVLVNQAGAALGIRLPDWRDAVTEYVQSGMLSLPAPR